MTGPHCQFPNDCQARGRGVHCRRCACSAQIRRLNADPAFRAASAARMRDLITSGRAFVSTPQSAQSRCATLMRRLGVPVGAEAVYRLARLHGFTSQEAVEMARRESAPRERVCGVI